MGEVDQDSLQKFFQEALQFRPGTAVIVHLSYGEKRFDDVQAFSILVLSAGMQLLTIRTPKAQYVFREWLGVGIDYMEGTNLQLS